MVSFSHAAVLNISNVARECQIERKTVAAYIEVLEDLLLSFRLPIFTRRARRQPSGESAAPPQSWPQRTPECPVAARSHARPR